MSYATVTDLQDRLGEARLLQLTDLQDPPLGLVDTAVAQKALDDADAEIDGYLVGRYALPLSPVPAILRVHAVTIAHYRLLGNAADEVTREDYRATRQWLMAVAKGDVVLTSPADDPGTGGAGSVLFAPGSKVMGREAA
ncbi:MAG: hypothetical protein AMXMBFR78_33850 [Rubrivivax sp.]